MTSNLLVDWGHNGYFLVLGSCIHVKVQLVKAGVTTGSVEVIQLGLGNIGDGFWIVVDFRKYTRFSITLVKPVHIKCPLFSIVSGNGFAPTRRQAIIWTSDGRVYWCIYASLGLNDLATLVKETFVGARNWDITKVEKESTDSTINLYVHPCELWPHFAFVTRATYFLWSNNSRNQTL